MGGFRSLLEKSQNQKRKKFHRTRLTLILMMIPRNNPHPKRNLQRKFSTLTTPILTPKKKKKRRINHSQKYRKLILKNKSQLKLILIRDIMI